jgi:hypothetical protein
MRFVGLGGSPVPAAVSARAEALGVQIVRGFGATEHPSITGATHGQPRAKRNETDGRPLLGNEIRLVDDDGRPVGPGEPGEILSRGAERFLGYTDAALTAKVLDADGWYRTGDIGVLDDEGWLTITDRQSDIIIRGGENVSAAEVEELLMTMTGVTEVAVVAAPDERMGEIGRAWFRMQPGATAPTLTAVREHLGAAGLARQKWPEDIRAVEEFPARRRGRSRRPSCGAGRDGGGRGGGRAQPDVDHLELDRRCVRALGDDDPVLGQHLVDGRSEAARPEGVGRLLGLPHVDIPQAALGHRQGEVHDEALDRLGADELDHPGVLGAVDGGVVDEGVHGGPPGCGSLH